MATETGACHGTLLHLEQRSLTTRFGVFRCDVFRDLSRGRPLLVLSRGDVSAEEPLLVRVHSSCVTSETYGACDCDCAVQLDAALERIATAGRGVLFYLLQEGRGAGLAAKARDRMWVQASEHELTTFDAYERMGIPDDHRSYESVGYATRLLGIRAPLRLLTNNPAKVKDLEAVGQRVAEVVPVRGEASPFNGHYLASKCRSGHVLPTCTGRPEVAELPERVVAFEPHPLPGAPQLVVLAAYLLPVRLPEAGAPRWFRLHLYLDRERDEERVALSHGAGADPVVHRGREFILERFPLLPGGAEKERWLGAAREMVERGAGVAVFRPPVLDDAFPPSSPDACGELLLDHHVRLLAEG